MADLPPLKDPLSAPEGRGVPADHIPADHIHVDLWPHPLTSEGRAPQITLPVTGPMSVSAALDAAWPARGALPLSVTLDGVALPPGAWAHTPIGPGQRLTLRARLQGDDSNPLVAILTIATIALSAGAASALAGSGALGFAAGSTGAKVIGALAGAAISTAGGLVINALVPVRDPDGLVPSSAPRTDYSLTGGTNRARPYAPLLLTFGRHRVFPDLGAKPWTEFEDDDQYLNMSLSFGLGNLHLDIADLRIGTQPLSNFPGATAEILRGPDPTWPANVDTVQGAALEDTAYVLRRTSAATNRFDLDLTGQLFGLDRRDGDPYRLSRAIEIGYRRVGPGGTWTRQRVIVRSKKDSPRDAIRRTIRIRPGAAADWEVRVRRLRAPSGDAHEVDAITWTALRSFQADTADYSGQTRLRLRLPASAQASGQLPALHAIVEHHLPHGTTRTARPRANSNPAWIALAFLRGDRIKGRLAWGLGLPDARIDLPGLRAWARWCDAHSLTCNLVLDRKLPAEEVLRTICQCGRASLTWASGKLGVVWDDPATPATALITPGNIIAGSLEITWSGAEPADEIAVRYLDPGADWHYQTLRRTMPGITTPKRTATLTLSGVTSPAQAATEANLQAARQLYHRRRITWEMAAEGLSIARGDVVRLTHSLLDGGQTGRLVNVLPAEPGTARPERWDLGQRFEIPDTETWYAMLRLGDGRLITRAITADGALVRPARALPEDWQHDETQATDVLWRVYPGDAPPAPLRIVGFEPVSASRIRLEAIDEVAAWHNAATADLTAPLPLPTPQSPRVLSAEITDRTRAGGGIALTLRLTTAGPWQGATIRARDSHGWRVVGDARQAATTVTFSTDDAPGRAIDIEITPGSRAAPTGPVFTTTHTLVGDRTVPIAAPEDFAVELLGDGSRRFTATPPPNTRVAGYALRYGPADAEATWDALTPLVHGRITALPLETRLPPAGRWRFALAALDRNGVPGTPARIGPVDLPDAVKLPVTQYAFLATSTETPPPGPARGGSTSDTHLPPGWSTTPVSLTAQSPVQWIIERKGRTGGGPWSNWTAPALWSKLGVDGENGTEGEPGRDGADGTDGRDGVDGEPGRDGQDGRDGIDGQDGAGVELIFRRTARNAPPDIPPPVPVATNVIQSRGSWVALFPNDSLPERLEDGFVFRFVAPADQSADQRMTAVEVDIEPLATGWVRNADGSALAPRQMRKGQSYDLRRHNTEWRLIDPPDTRSDYVPPDWSDDPVGVTPAEPYEWVSERRGRAGAWSAFTAPTLWARYARDGAPGRPGTKGNTGARGAQGLQGLPGRDGQDGVGVELIFRRSATNRRPATPRSTADQRQSSDYVPEDWSDDPVGVTPAEPYEWVSERRGRAGAWSAFTAPTLWARYARDGAPGRPGRPGRTGLPGRDGQDGPGLEFIFRLTATPIRPATPRTTAAQRRIDDHVPDNWSDDAPEVSAAMPWLWVSRRKGSSGNWSAFSRPVQWARYARDGRPGADGADGEPGRNGADGRDGRPGTKGDKGDDGARGARGAGTFAQSIPSRGWIDRIANAATPGDTVAGDVVTLFDSAGGWAETRAWSGRAWVPVAHVINGNTVIPGTLLAEAIAAGQIESRHLQADQAVITNGLQLGSSLITVSHLDDTLIGDVARGGRWRLSASRQPSLNRSGAHTANGGLTTPPRSDGGSDIVVRRDHADEIMRYSLTLNLSLSPSNARHVTRPRERGRDEETAWFAYQHGVTLQVEVRIDNVVVTTRQVTYSGKGISHSEKLIEAVLPAHLTPIGQQRRLSVRAGYSVTTEPPKPRYGLGTRRGIVTAWSLNATFTLTARETRPFA